MDDVKAITFGRSTVVLSHVTHYENYLSGLTVHLDGGGSVECSKEESDGVLKFLNEHFNARDLTKQRPPAGED
jgi:hypothetical protein